MGGIPLILASTRIFWSALLCYWVYTHRQIQQTFVLREKYTYWICIKTSLFSGLIFVALYYSDV